MPWPGSRPHNVSTKPRSGSMGICPPMPCNSTTACLDGPASAPLHEPDVRFGDASEVRRVCEMGVSSAPTQQNNRPLSAAARSAVYGEVGSDTERLLQGAGIGVRSLPLRDLCTWARADTYSRPYLVGGENGCYSDGIVEAVSVWIRNEVCRRYMRFGRKREVPLWTS